MTIPVRTRRRIKAILRPAALPLLRRLRLPFDLMLPRIEALERQVDSIPPPSPNIDETLDRLRRDLDCIRGTVSNLTEALDPLRKDIDGIRGTVSNLIRTWLRLQNEVSRLTSSIPEGTELAAKRWASGFEARLQDSEAGAAALLRQVSELDAQLQAVKYEWQENNAGRGRRVDETLRFLLDRVEFVRREMMFELRYAPGDNILLKGRRRTVESRVLAPEKVQAARTSGVLRLNIGCGHITKPDYINVDMRDLPGVDVVAEAGGLPFEPNSVDEIFSAHLIEHFPQEELRRRLLPHWRSMLKLGGSLRAVTPDGEAMLAKLAQGSYSFDDFREVLFGSQDYEGDFHYNLLTPHSLSHMIEEARFTDIEVPVRGRRNGQCFEFELTARRPSSS